MVEQLNKLLAHISLLAFLMNFKPHRKALMKVLSEAYVAHNISVEKVDQLVGNIFANNMIAISDDEIPSGKRGNTKAFYITINCKGYTLPRALLDNGSSMNVIPMATLSRYLLDNGSSINVIHMATLSRFPIDLSHIRKTHLVVHAFYGTRK